MTTPAPVGRYLARLRLKYPLDTENGVYNGYLTELRRDYKDKTGKVMEWVSFAGSSRVKPDPNAAAPFEMEHGAFRRAVLRIVREKQLISSTLLEFLDIAIDLRREASRLHTARDIRDVGNKTPETISHEWFTENVLKQARTRLETLGVVHCTTAKPASVTPPLELKNTFDVLKHVEARTVETVGAVD